MDWDLYDKKLTINGNSKRERSINCFQEIANKKFTNHPSCKLMVINGIEQNLMIYDTDKFDEKKFNTMPNETIEIGEIFSWNDEHWVVSEADYDDEVYRKGKILKCNHLLRWQDIETGVIHEMWSVFKKPYTTGIDEKNVITTPDAKYKLSISYNEFTKKFFIDKRLAVGTIYQKINDKLEKILDVYSIIDFNPITQTVGEHGFVEIILQKDTYNANNDSLDLEICDYIEVVDNSDTDETQLTSKIEGKAFIKNSGVFNYYNAIFYNSNQTINNNIVAKWSINCKDEIKDKLKIVFDGNKIGICCTDDMLVGDMLTLTLTDIGGLYPIVTMDVNIISIFG